MGSYTDHHPACEDYKANRYIRLYDDDGHSFIDVPAKQYLFLEIDSGEWKQEDVYLTEDQFYRLKEYQGF